MSCALLVVGAFPNDFDWGLFILLGIVFVEQLSAYDFYVAGCVDSNSDLLSVNLGDVNEDVIVNNKGFVNLPGQDQHGDVHKLIFYPVQAGQFIQQ